MMDQNNEENGNQDPLTDELFRWLAPDSLAGYPWRKELEFPTGKLLIETIQCMNSPLFKVIYLRDFCHQRKNATDKSSLYKSEEKEKTEGTLEHTVWAVSHYLGNASCHKTLLVMTSRGKKKKQKLQRRLLKKWSNAENVTRLKSKLDCLQAKFERPSLQKSVRQKAKAKVSVTSENTSVISLEYVQNWNLVVYSLCAWLT